MHIAILTFDGFNELDSFIAIGVLNRIKRPDWKVSLAAPTPWVTSMNGVRLERQAGLEEIEACAAVLVGSGIRTREIACNVEILEQLSFIRPTHQLIGAQCSGALLLAKLGLLKNIPACTDLTTKPWVEDTGIDVLDQPFFAHGNLATAGGCLASSYLAAWTIARLIGREAAADALHYVAPVGEKEIYVKQALENIAPYLPD
ncbi:DJ-1/PfpI family protein [Pseudomonas luteola]